MSEVLSLPISSSDAVQLSRSPSEIERKITIAHTSNGEVRLELGADGVFILFDGPCLEMLPFCQAQCCALKGTGAQSDEIERLDAYLDWDNELGMPVMRRDADGFCTCLDRKTRRCGIYEERPYTCQQFHCTRGAHQRGFKLPNAVHRQSIS